MISRKEKLIYLLFSVLVLGFFINNAEVSLAYREYDINNSNLIDAKTADVTGDKVEDKIVLIGNKLSNIFAYSLTVIVQDGRTEEYLEPDYKKFSGYDGKLYIGDFNGDKVSDVMLIAANGGSGGIEKHRIFSFKDNKAKTLFSHQDDTGLNIEGKFIENFKVKLKNTNLDKEQIVKLEPKEKYIKNKVYSEDGNLLKQVNCSIYPFSNLIPIDYDYDGKYELSGHQRIVGFSNADTIAFVHSIWEYEDGKWNLKQVFTYKMINMYFD